MATTASRLVDIQKGIVDRGIFIDEELYQQELEQVFGRCWLFVGHESQVAKVNDFAASYMGEDPILYTRDAKGKLHAFLNMCRHRGNRICRADSGNSPSFMCTYHGWTFATDGKLVGVPGYKEAYFEELDRSQWGLVEAGQIESYKGLTFATWDKSAPKLVDYLGDAAWYMDLLVDRREGGTELLNGIHRWVLKANWKFGADNFGGDNYHFPITHGSSVTVRGNARNFSAPINSVPDRVNVHAGNGHGILGRYNGAGENMNDQSGGRFQGYFDTIKPEVKQRLGDVRSRQGSFGIATVFPNFTWHGGPMVRVWHPRGAAQMEVWSYCIVDKAAPQEVKDLMRQNLTSSFGPSGFTEQDDMNNWLQCTATARSRRARDYVMNIQMGKGHEMKSEMLPGELSSSVSETNQRGFYGRWAEIMAAPSWNQIHIDPRTK